MRGTANPQSTSFSYISLEDRIPRNHPLRKFRVLVDAVLSSLDEEFDAVYAEEGRPSIPPERLLKASLLEVLFSIRSERLLVEPIDFNLLYRWFVGLSLDERVWNHSTFSQNRDRLFNEGMARIFFERVKMLADWKRLTSSDHFSVDGTLIEAWASHKSLRRKDGQDDEPLRGGSGRNAERDFRGQTRSNDTHQSTTDPEARLSRKSPGSQAKLAHMNHVLMENRNGLIVDVETTESNGRAEREAAIVMMARSCRHGSTVGADRGYDSRDFVDACEELGVKPHVARKRRHSAIDGRVARSKAYRTSLKIRKRIEKAFGWLTTVGGLRKTKLIGRAKLAGHSLLCFAAYNLIRIGSLSGWWNARHA